MQQQIERVLTPLELRASEAVIVAEKLALMLEVIHADASALTDKVLESAHGQMLEAGWIQMMNTATGLIDLSAKIRAYREEMQPLVDDIAGKEAQAERERRAPTLN